MIPVAVALMFAVSAEELYRRGVQAFERGDAHQAVEALKEASQLAPKNAQIWKVLGVAYASAEDFEHAAEPFERACSLDAKLADACYYHGRNLYALNQFERSLHVLRKVLPGDRSPWRVHLGIGQALEALGKAVEAESEFLAAIRQAESPRADFDPRMHYAIFLFRQGRTQDAIAPAADAAKAHPQAARPQFELGRILYQRGHLTQAVEHLDRAQALGYTAARPLLDKARARLKAESASPPN